MGPIITNPYRPPARKLASIDLPFIVKRSEELPSRRKRFEPTASYAKEGGKTDI